MRSLHEDKCKLEGELKKARTDREAAEDKLAELKLQHDGLQELMATLKDGKGAAKVTEWHAKMGEIRLQDLKLNRAITRMQEEVIYDPLDGRLCTYKKAVLPLKHCLLVNNNVKISYS